MTKDTVSLDIARKLRDGGWPLEKGHCMVHGCQFCPECPAAPTIGELLDKLPNPRDVSTSNLTLYRCDDDTWEAYFDDWASSDSHVNYLDILAKSDNAADCLALLWLELKKQGKV